MSRPYRFGKFYGIVVLLGAIYSAWFAGEMLWYGFFWAGLLAAAGVPLNCATGIGLLYRRRFGILCLNFSIALGIAANIYSWFRPSQYLFIYRIVGNLAFFALMAIIFTYFYKRRSEFT
jgi:hypothetical protein